MPPEAFPYTLVLKDGGAQIFKSIQDLQQWLDGEGKFWAWLSEVLETQIGIQEDRRHAFLSQLSQARALLSPPNRNNEQALRIALDYYAQTGLASTTPRAQYLEKTRLNAGKLLAGVAIADFLGSTWHPHANVPEQHRYTVSRGKIVLPLFDEGAVDGAGEALKNSAAAIVSGFHQNLNREFEAAEDARKLLEDARQKSATEHVAAQEKIAAEWLALNSEIKQTFADATAQFQNTELAYKEQMKLRSSVQYWASKSKDHAGRTKTQKAWIVGYFISALLVGGIFIAFMFGEIVGLAKDLGEKASAPMLVLASTTVLVVSALVWIGRILVRVYFDERQRTLDASERATMAETYSALTHEGLVTPSERMIVLSALFRPTADGSGREDGAPEAIQYTLLARLLDTKEK